ncbi:GerAB/ArcD/ProY family transporter [Sporosarcina aquimarina]|uniref:GerAB/ArcD/ProY family transporter n=1 Tax=Sporosarcina aquimarina TaxID=114975 RepID=A0ABU4G281_9BACL|nr:GerAB/ArcD/ProY family transporter [Sporosarcina aquimarina]MDW0111080.1 GerAB/ArcD/ProY family transporter [Sporosarcina aquimarina]
MSRFVYYLILTNMLAIIMSPIPRLLLLRAGDGALSGMIVGIIGGALFTYVTVSFFLKYPGQDLIELLTKYTSSWIQIPVTLYFAFMWFIAGTITLIMTVFLLITFLTPVMSIYIISLSILITIFFGVLLKTKSILFTLEILCVLMIPVTVLMFFKMFTSHELDFDQVRLAVMHIKSIPDFTAFNASTFTFMGSANLIIFNKYFKEKQNISKWSIICITLASIFMLINSYLVPIGFTGFDEIDQLMFPWTSSADSVRMKFGFIERVVFIFMFLFVTISFISIIIHWHVAYKLLSSIFRLKSLQIKQQNFTPLLISFIFCAVGLWLTVSFTQYQLYEYSKYYYNILPIFAGVLFLTMLAIRKGATS